MVTRTFSPPANRNRVVLSRSCRRPYSFFFSFLLAFTWSHWQSTSQEKPCCPLQVLPVAIQLRTQRGLLLLLLLFLLAGVHVVTLAVQQPRESVLSSPGPAGGRTASYAAVPRPLAKMPLSAHIIMSPLANRVNSWFRMSYIYS